MTKGGMIGEGGKCMVKEGACKVKVGMCGEGWVCMVKRGMHAKGAMRGGWGGHAWQGVHCQGACMRRWEHAWQCGGVNGKGSMCAGETATEAGSTHPTGMHSCLEIFAAVFKYRVA